MTTLDVLISTCNHRILNLANMNLLPYANVRYLVIHQVFEQSLDSEKIAAFSTEISRRDDIEIHLMSEQGLSKSRNAALAKSTADICLISDDDVTYLPEVIPKIIQVFEQYPQQDIITFKMLNRSGQPTRKYPGGNQHPLTPLTKFPGAVDFWSAEIAFRRTSIWSQQVWFNQQIGLGTEFPVGEETLFLAECFQQHLTIAHYDLPICIFPESSTGEREDLPMYFTRGVVWSKIYGGLAFWWQIHSNLVLQCNLQSWLKLAYYLRGCCYYLTHRQQFKTQIDRHKSTIPPTNSYPNLATPNSATPRNSIRVKTDENN